MVRRLYVGIVGCGVAGLTAAVALGRRGHRVTLIERAASPGPVGAGLLLQPSGQLVLSRLNLLEQAVAGAEPIEHLHAWTHRQRTLVRLSYKKLRGAHLGYGVHRGDLFGLLYSHAREAGAELRLGITIKSSRQQLDRILAVDDQGAEHGPFDVLIAADGARSRLREAPELGAVVRQFPLGAAWFSGRCDTVRRKLHQVTRGTHQLIGLLPVGGGRCSLFCALPAGGTEALRQRGIAALREEISSLCPEATPLVDQIGSLDDLACTQYQIAALRRWNFGRLICIGDAAHSTTPHLGQGVNLALLDALVVASALDREQPPEQALHEAAVFRRRQVRWSWTISNLLGPVFQSEGRLLAAGRDQVLPWLPSIPLIGHAMVGTMAGLRTGLFSHLRVDI